MAAKAALGTVTAFLAAFSLNHQSCPSAQGPSLILPHGFAVSYGPASHDVLHRDLSDYVRDTKHDLSKLQYTHNVKIELTAPEPEVFTFEDSLAAVWTGYHVVVDGKEVKHGIMLFSLLKYNGTDDRYKITAIAEREWSIQQHIPTTTHSADFLPELEGVYSAVKARDWDGKFASSLLPGGGVVLPRDTIQTLKFPQWIAAEKEVFANETPGNKLSETFQGLEPRTAGDFAFGWVTFVVTQGGKRLVTGREIFTWLRVDNAWKVTGLQDIGVNL